MKWWKKPWVLPVGLTVVILFGSNWYIKQLMHEDVMPEEQVKTRLEAMYQGTVERLSESSDGYEAEIMRNGALYSATVDHRTGKVQALTLLKEAEPDLATKPADEKPQTSSDEKTVEEPSGTAGSSGTSEKSGTAEQSGTAKQPVPLPKAEQPAAEQVQPQKPQPSQQAKPQSQPAPKKSVILTEQQAVNIALKQLNTKVPFEVDDVDFVKTQEGGYYLVEIELDTDADYDEVTYQIHAISGKIMSESWDD